MSSPLGIVRRLQPQGAHAPLNLTLGCPTLNLAPQAIAQRPGCGKCLHDPFRSIQWVCLRKSTVNHSESTENIQIHQETMCLHIKVRAVCRFSLETGEAWMKVEVLMTLRSWSQGMPPFPRLEPFGIQKAP